MTVKSYQNLQTIAKVGLFVYFSILVLFISLSRTYIIGKRMYDSEVEITLLPFSPIMVNKLYFDNFTPLALLL